MARGTLAKPLPHGRRGDIIGAHGRDRIRIIVIGAGVAGLTAANIAHTAGHDVVVLEARPRLGGRTWTVPLGHSHTDLGAAWIHGQAGNPLVTLFETLGVDIVQLEGLGNPVSVTMPDGSRWHDDQVATLVPLWERFDGAHLERALGPDASVREAVDRWVADQDLGPHEETAVRFFVEELDCGLNFGASSSDLSIHGYAQYDILDDVNALPRGGYSRLVDALAEPLAVELETSVDAVAWHDGGARVRSRDSEWQGDAVVVTVPLAVLGAGVPTFVPPLPSAKAEAIASLGMADLRKVVFLFDGVSWPDEGYWLHRSDPPGEFPFAVDLHRVRGEPVIEVEYSGRTDAASLLPGALEEAALSALRLMVGPQLPDPVAVVHSMWHDDPYSRGSYSYLPVGANAADMDHLGAPVGPLHFAGEATCARFHGTVHAAYLSGRRAAAEILERSDLALSFLDPAPGAPPEDGGA